MLLLPFRNRFFTIQGVLLRGLKLARAWEIEDFLKQYGAVETWSARFRLELGMGNYVLEGFVLYALPIEHDRWQWLVSSCKFLGHLLVNQSSYFKCNILKFFSQIRFHEATESTVTKCLNTPNFMFRPLIAKGARQLNFQDPRQDLLILPLHLPVPSKRLITIYIINGFLF